MIRLAVTTLLTVPNISEGRDHAVIEAIAPAFGLPVLNIHSDPDHHRTVFTVAGRPGELAPAVAAAAHMATATIDISAHDGIHPRIGALDVAPIVFLAEADRGAACAEALVLADRLAEELELPVLLYGILADGRTRAELRRGGPDALKARIETGELDAGFWAATSASQPPARCSSAPARRSSPSTSSSGPRRRSRTPSGSLPSSARAVPTGCRECEQSGCGSRTAASPRSRPTSRTIGPCPLGRLVDAIAKYAEPLACELVGLAPAAAFEGFPHGLVVRNQRLIEDALVD